jgi:hypothetical protein
MSDLFRLAKTLEVLESKTRERDKFWIEACARNQVDFAQIRSPQPVMVSNPSIGSSATWLLAPPARTNVKSQAKLMTAPPRPVLPLGPEISRLQNSQATGGANAPKTQNPDSAEAFLNTLPKRPLNSLPERPLKTLPELPLNILPEHPLHTVSQSDFPTPDKNTLPVDDEIDSSTTNVDRSRDPRLNHGAFESNTVRSTSPGAASGLHQPGNDRHMPGADHNSEVDSSCGTGPLRQLSFPNNVPVNGARLAARNNDRLSQSATTDGTRDPSKTEYSHRAKSPPLGPRG